MKKLLFSCLIVFSTMNINTVSAGTLDLTEVGSTGLIGSTVINLSEATLTSNGSDFFIGAPGVFGETNNLGIVCGAAVDGSCEADWQIDFATDVSDLTTSSFAATVGDNVQVSAFLNNILLGSILVTTDMLVDFSSFGVIDRLFFDDNSTQNGIGFGDFSFTNVSTVPAPAAVWLFGTALLGFFGLRRKASQSN